MNLENAGRYRELQATLGRGWNTWDVRSVLSHVFLPTGLAVRLGLKEYGSGGFLAEALVGRPGDDVEQVRPGLRSYDGSYVELELSWRGIRCRVESSSDEDGLSMLVTPLPGEEPERPRRASLVVSAAFPWNRPGVVRRVGEALHAEMPDGPTTAIRCTGVPVEDRNVPVPGPFLAVALEQQRVLVCVGRTRRIDEVRRQLDERRAELHASLGGGERGELRAAIQACLAWDTIHDPDHARVISPVSRTWSASQGGWVLFCWDTYFAALLAAVTGQRDLAYANLVEITRHATPAGFVPNTTNAHGFVTRDRSQPPVGGLVLREVYRLFGERWIVDLLLDALLQWNRWWPGHRRLGDCLAWGSNAYEPVVGNEWETAEKGVGGRFGAALESGLDNSPMYDDVPFDPGRETLLLQDAGLTALYVADCDALAELAAIVGRDDQSRELRTRGEEFRRGLATLWCDGLGIYANRRTDTGQFSNRVSPTCFYPLLAGVVTPSQATRMLKEHLHAPHRFGGEWVLPSIARDDPAYPEQHYWRGRIWAPLNYLVWLGLRHAGLRDAADELAAKSARLLLKEWRSHGHVHENYHAETGEGCGYRWSDPLYHWGGLLGVPLLTADQE